MKSKPFISDMHLQQQLLNRAQEVLNIEANAITNIGKSLGDDFVHACELILNCQGKVVVTGMGKSGHIGNKIAATLASTGTPAFFLHPAEASHGDLGMLEAHDILLALSNSGEVDEILVLLPLIKRLGLPIISITGNAQSSLAKNSTVHLWAKIEKEACPLGLAPTTSTTVALALGDALGVALLEARGFTSEDFARSHPGGKLGRQLLLHVDDIMLKAPDLPVSQPNDTLSQVLVEMTKHPVNIAAIVENEQVIGVFSEGDLRRALMKNIDFKSILIKEIMTKNFIYLKSGSLAVDAVNLMETKRITALPVLNEHKHLLGIIHMHHLLQARVV